MDSNELGHSDYLRSSESSLECPHELQNQHARTLPHPLLCAGSDWFFLFRVCGPVYPALQQPKDRWAKHTESASHGCHAELNYIRWHYVTITCISLAYFLHSVRNKRLSPVSNVYIKHLHISTECSCYIYFSFNVLLQATAGYRFGPETDAAWIQPPSSSLFGIPKSSSLHWDTYTQTSCQQIEKRVYGSYNNKKNINKSKAQFPQI